MESKQNLDFCRAYVERIHRMVEVGSYDGGSVGCVCNLGTMVEVER